MRVQHHMSVNIEGILRNYKRKKINFFEDDNGKPLTDKEARQYLNECKEKGWRLVPCGTCEGFDYQKGCPGHPLPNDEQNDERSAATGAK